MSAALHVQFTISGCSMKMSVTLQSLKAYPGAAQQYKGLDATFATIVGVCAFASSVIIGWICEVSSPLLHTCTHAFQHFHAERPEGIWSDTCLRPARLL